MEVILQKKSGKETTSRSNRIENKPRKRLKIHVSAPKRSACAYAIQLRHGQIKDTDLTNEGARLTLI